MLRFSLASLLGLVVVVAPGFAALGYPTQLWMQVMVTSVLALLIFCTALLAYHKGALGAAAGGMAIVGWIYFGLGLALVESEMLLTNTATKFLFEVVHGVEEDVEDSGVQLGSYGDGYIGMPGPPNVSLPSTPGLTYPSTAPGDPALEPEPKKPAPVEKTDEGSSSEKVSKSGADKTLPDANKTSKPGDTPAPGNSALEPEIDVDPYVAPAYSTLQPQVYTPPIPTAAATPIDMSYDEMRTYFLVIGHCLWTLLLGAIGAIMAAACRKRRLAG